MDQIAAKALGQQTQLPSLELALEGTDSNVVATCDPGYQLRLHEHRRGATPTTPLPMETNPRTVFERLFGDAGSTDPQVRLARIGERRSILDSVIDKVAAVEARARDRRSREAQRVSRSGARRRAAHPDGRGAEYAASCRPSSRRPAFRRRSTSTRKLMFDLQVLAYQTDLTRVITFMIGRELSGATYPQIGVTDSHHPITHQLTDPANVAKVAKINAYHATLFAEFVEKLQIDARRRRVAPRPHDDSLRQSA